MKYRLQKETLSWVAERYEPGGEIAKRGRTAGQPKAARWVHVGYYPSLKWAAKGLLDTIIGEEGGEITGREILTKIEEAEARIEKIVEEALTKSQG